MLIISWQISSGITHLVGFVAFVDRDLVVWWWFGDRPCRLSFGAAVAACCSRWLFSTVVAVIRVVGLGFGFGSWAGLGPLGSCHF